MADCGCGLKFSGGGKRRATRKTRKSKKSRKGTRRVRKH